MLTDPKAIEIVANAKQKNVRDPKRSRKHFLNIFEDFLGSVNFEGNYLDMGPGQYDFGVIAKEKGANQCCAIEYDPAVIELGKYLGFDVIEGNIKLFDGAMTNNLQFEGVFNKFSYNAFWYVDNAAKHEKFVSELTASIKEDGWAWIAPWNGVPKAKELSQRDIDEILMKQAKLFEDRGFTTHSISVREAKKYGINGSIANNVIFTFGL